MSYETSMKKLEEMSEKIHDKETTLEEAIRCYEEGIQAYNDCDRILKDARQKIEVYKK